jgi:hypothetical protein
MPGLFGTWVYIIVLETLFKPKQLEVKLWQKVYTLLPRIVLTLSTKTLSYLNTNVMFPVLTLLRESPTDTPNLMKLFYQAI